MVAVRCPLPTAQGGKGVLQRVLHDERMARLDAVALVNFPGGACRPERAGGQFV